jgi:hypothetical protein
MVSSAALPDKRIYLEPKLLEFGCLTAITKAASKAGTRKDGGPNNTKT